MSEPAGGPAPRPDPSSSGAAAVPEYETWRCYRHPERKGSVRCRRCERPICPDCMVTASVGFQCPNCARGAPGARTLRSLRQDPWVTWVVVGLCAALFLPTVALGAGGGPDVRSELGVNAPTIADGEWWRLLTGGFVHFDRLPFGLFHIGLNMLALYQLGSLLEPALGRARFAGLYLAGLLGGSFGAVLLSPYVTTVGASGAVYGLLGATAVGLRARGVDVMRSGIGSVLVINLLFTFLVPGISIGGHLGGLAAGAAAGAILFRTDGTPGKRRLGGLAVAGLCLALAVAGVVVAANPL